MLDRVISANGKEIVVTQDLSLSHAGTVWDGALCQIAYLNKNPQIASKFITGKRVLQLGSGTGILGLAACMYQPKQIYLTDLPQYLSLIQLNKEKNLPTLPNPNKTHICPLQWGNFTHIQQIPNIDTIIGSQLAYDKGCVIQLMNTLSYYKKHNPDLKIMVSYQKYREEGKNIEMQFKNVFGEGNYWLVGWHDMDEDYRDDGIGIVVVG